jgi:hypothetical protein
MDAAFFAVFAELAISPARAQAPAVDPALLAKALFISLALSARLKLCASKKQVW